MVTRAKTVSFLVGRVVGPALAGLLGAAFACSSSSTHPPMLPGCMEVDGVPCSGGVIGGGVSPQSDAASDDSSTGGSGDATSCPGASTIFGATTAACVTCITASCCLNPTSCPNDSACSVIATCVLACLPTDPTCVQGCEGQASSATVTAFTDLASCSMSNCSVCPTIQTASGDL